ncbi:alpha/beta hydrolase [Paraglaciecola aquimarina]|uniref:Alpha/beta hydrolase n=1 Tax=Paraglaciecola aquimarina TaxID=1235557 RepID=A0ABU3SX74_9ALTE|nr:alpha/beta hydrolase [Paraglaciecola aquimarina]MDU0354604.1 alpha/beta hydrolase [Paraglaciecola aquimarina]
MQRELEFKLKHITLRGMGFGDSNKPMILALHGWLDNAASFAPLAPYLADYYVLAIDLAGHGLSDHRSPDAHYHLLDFVYDLHELVEIQGWQRFVLMGHSLGAIIASLYASSFTERVDRLICIEALGPLTKSATTSASQLRESILNRLNLSTSPSTRPKTIARVINARAFVGELSVSSAELLVRRNTSERDGQLFYRTDRRLRTVSALRMTEEQARAFVSSIVCPVLLITGDKGFETFASEIKDRMTRLDLGQHVCCSGNHHVHMDNPTDVALKVVNFLE